MKIIINENENYEIEIPSEIEGKDFLNVVEKLIKLSKFIQISSFDINDKNQKIQNKNPLKRKTYNSRKKYLNTKEKMMDILQYYYHGNKSDRNRIAKICGYEDFVPISKRIATLRNNFNIQPNEIGLIQFPTKENRNIMVKDGWIIKSYTGIFDEKEENSDEVIE